MPFAERPADDFVERVVAAYVLADAEKARPRNRKETRWRGDRRSRRTPSEPPASSPGRDETTRFGQSHVALHTEARRPASPSIAPFPQTPQEDEGVEVPTKPLQIEACRLDVDGVRGQIVRERVPRAARGPAATQKPSASSSSCPRRAHGDRDRLAADPDLERLLDCKEFRSPRLPPAEAAVRQRLSSSTVAPGAAESRAHSRLAGILLGPRRPSEPVRRRRTRCESEECDAWLSTMSSAASSPPSSAATCRHGALGRHRRSPLATGGRRRISARAGAGTRACGECDSDCSAKYARPSRDR